MRYLALLAALTIAACSADSSGHDVDEQNNTDSTDGKGDDFRPAAGTFRIDRMGHVEVGPLIIADMPVADAFNQEEPYGLQMTADDRVFYSAALQTGLVRYDNYDSFPLELFDLDLDTLEHIRADREGMPTDPSRLDWIKDLSARHPLVDMYLTDALFIDLSKPCDGTNGYLEPERAVLAGQPHQTCGGRHINEDVIDTMATLWINGPTPRGIHPDDDIDPADADPYPNRGDSVEEPARPASGQFPYLDRPYTRFLFN